MSSKAKHLAVGVPAKAHTHAHQRARRVRSRQLPWAAIVAAALLIAVVAFVANGILRESGRLVAANTNYNFGQVAYKGGFITTRFPLTVDGDTRVTDITTT